MTATPDVLDLLGADRSGVAITDGLRVVTYAELAPAVRRRAAALAGHGVTPGDRVVVSVVNSVAAVELYLGCLLLGAVWVGVNPAAPPAERERLRTLVRPALVITDDPDVATGPGRVVGPSVVLGDNGGQWARPAPSADLPCAIAFTSGTSGSPKPVVQTRAGASLTAAAAATRFRADDRVGLILPLSIHNVMTVGAMAALLSGANAVAVAGLNARGVARACAEHALTMVSALVPTTIFDLVHDQSIAPAALQTLRWAGSGGADLSEGLRAAFEDKFGVGVLGSYGLTEAGGVVCLEEPGSPHRPGCSGPALPHARLEIRDQTGLQLGPGQRGRVQVCPATDGPWAGLFSPPRWEWTEDGMRPCPAERCLATGDYGALDDDGGLYIHGRESGMIVRGGVNVTAAEVETALAGLDTVREAVVFGEPDERLGERIVAFVEPTVGAAPDAAVLAEEARNVLAHSKMPDEFVIVAHLPRNALGKVVRAQLPSRRPTRG